MAELEPGGKEPAAAEEAESPEPFAKSSPVKSRKPLPDLKFKTPPQSVPSNNMPPPERGPSQSDIEDIDLFDDDDTGRPLSIVEEGASDVGLLDVSTEPEMPSIPPSAFESAEECAERLALDPIVEKTKRAVDERFREMKTDLMQAIEACNNLNVSFVNYVQKCLV